MRRSKAPPPIPRTSTPWSAPPKPNSKPPKAAPSPSARCPLIYILGDENSAKTQTVLQSGLDAELLAGQLHRDGQIAPTPLANIWFTGTAAVVEAGGALLRQPGLWQRLVRLTQPSKIGAAFSRGALQPTRAAILCISRRAPQRSANPLKPSARSARPSTSASAPFRRRSASRFPSTFSSPSSTPSPPSRDYAVNLTDDEVREPLGSLLGQTEATAGLYGERATAQSAERFDELCYSLSEFRLEVLGRGGEPDRLARAYEFPRELRKLRGAIVDLLVEIGRPSQLGVNPFLRGFFFSGMRARLVEDTPSDNACSPGAPAPARRRRRHPRLLLQLRRRTRARAGPRRARYPPRPPMGLPAPSLSAQSSSPTAPPSTPAAPLPKSMASSAS